MTMDEANRASRSEQIQEAVAYMREALDLLDALGTAHYLGARLNQIIEDCTQLDLGPCELQARRVEELL